MRTSREIRQSMTPDARKLSQHPQFKKTLARERNRLNKSFPQTQGLTNNIEAASKACLVIGARAELAAVGRNSPEETLIFLNPSRQKNAADDLKTYIQNTPGGRRWRLNPLG